jgi:hypothetical protein
MIPQPTEQYGQVLRVSVVRESLKLRVSARAAVGEKPSATRLEAARPAPLTRKNSLRFMSMAGSFVLWFYLATLDADAPSPLVGAGSPPLVAPPLSCVSVKPPTAVFASAGPVPLPRLMPEPDTSGGCATIPDIGEEELAGSEMEVALELEIGLDADDESRSHPAVSSETQINANVRAKAAQLESIEFQSFALDPTACPTVEVPFDRDEW